MRLKWLLTAVFATTMVWSAADAAQIYYRHGSGLITLPEGSGGGVQEPVEPVQDTTPNPFAFATSTEIVPGAVVESGIVQIGGLDIDVPVVSTGGEHRVCLSETEDCGSWSIESTIGDGQWLQLRQTASESFETQTTMHVAVGGGGADWSVTTKAANSPDDFVLADSGSQYMTVWVKITGAAESYPLELSAVNKVSGAHHPAYWMACPSAGICQGSWNSTPTGTFETGKFLQVFLPIQPYNSVLLTVKVGDMVKTVTMYEG